MVSITGCVLCKTDLNIKIFQIITTVTNDENLSQLKSKFL